MVPVEVRGLVKRYGRVLAVDDVDLTVERGDVYGYLGPNGAGKTTTLRILLGLIRPDAGSVRLFGRDPVGEGARATGGVSLVGALLSWGFHPVRTTGGATVAAGHALGLVVAAYAVYLLPVLVIASFAFFLSTVTRNSAAALVGALLFALGFQLVAALPGIGSVKHYLLPAQFNAWESLFGRGDGDALIARAAWTCALYAGIPLLAGWLYFRRRDVAGD